MSHQHTVIIGTRGSQLALWQANHVKEQLESAGLVCEIKVIETKGDQMLDVALSKIGSKGVFTEELETQLLEGHIHLAVHSAKDLQSELAEPFEIIAFLRREKENDVIISHHADFELTDSPDITIGTSSTRRVALLKRMYPKVQVVDARGNLQTRIQKLQAGLADALLLAYAGVHRMGYDHLIKAELDLDVFVPPAGQGSIAVQCLKSLDEKLKKQIKKLLNHEPTALCVSAERAFLKTMQGGCSIPVFCHCKINEKTITITGGLLSLDGKIMLKESRSQPYRILNEQASAQAQNLAADLALKILNHGGRELLYNVKQSFNLK